MASVLTSLPFPAEQPAAHKLTYRTDILRARDGTEHRLALMTKPRQSFEYRYLLDEEELRQVRALLYNDTDSTWDLPLWHEAFRTTGEATLGGNTVTATFTNHDIANGQRVFIWDKPTQRGEFQTVTSIVGSTLTITGTWGATFAAGSHIYPALKVQVRDGQALGEQHGLSEFAVQCDATEFYALGGSGASLTTYQSLTLLDRQPIRASAVREDWQRHLSVIDFGVRLSVVAGASRAEATRSLAFRIPDRTELQFWKLFFDTVVGQREPFYHPTWRHDLELDSAPAGGASVITVKNNPAFGARWFTTGASHKDLQLDLSTGAQIYRRVNSQVDNGDGTSDLTLDSALPDPVTINMVSFLELVRLGTDEIQFNHSTTRSYVEISTMLIEQ